MFFRIPCYWQVHGYLEIVSDTVDDALEEAYLCHEPSDGKTIDGSLVVEEQWFLKSLRMESARRWMGIGVDLSQERVG